jgi:hypothetical protein
VNGHGSGRWEDGGLCDAAAVKKRLLKGCDFLAEGHILRARCTKFCADGVDKTITLRYITFQGCNIFCNKKTGILKKIPM